MDNIKFLQEKLNDDQIKPVLETSGAVLVLAGAGSGKTRVLAYRIYHLVKHLNISPYNILAITFTNKAADEMKERLTDMLGDITGMWVCTIHSMCAKILRMNAGKLGYTKDFTIYSMQDSERVIKRLLTEFKIDDKKLKSVKWHISNAKNNNYNPDEYFKVGTTDKDIINIYKVYEDSLKASNAMDFDDLLVKTYYLLNNFEEIKNYFQEKFQFIHIDEFQDTNEIQYKLALILAGKFGNIFVVGDDDQSIYSFRGAQISNIFDFQKHFKDVKIFKLEKNYRSTKKILNAANYIIKYNTHRMDKNLWTDNSEGVRIETYRGNDENYEANYVVSAIKSLIDYYGYKYSDFAILMRVNALSRAFEAECLKYNIPVKVFGGFKFFERKEIKDIIAYLRIVINPFDEDAILRVINIPKRGIGDAAIQALKTYAKNSNLLFYDVILTIEKTNLASTLINKIKPFKDLVLDLIKANESLNPIDFIDYAVKATKIPEMFNEDTEEDINKKLNIDEFISSAKDFFRQNPDSDLSDFLQSVTLISGLDDDDNGDNFVSIATIHSVKGLEFKVVFVVGLEENLFPVSSAQNKTEELEEERRLMYVAITRAKERLYLTRASTRYIYGERQLTFESRFLRELSGLFGPENLRKKANFNEEDYNAPDREPVGVNIYRPPEQKKDFSGFTVGKKVVHTKFGEGTILKVTKEGVNIFCDIAFAGIGVKTMSLQFAPLVLKE